MTEEILSGESFEAAVRKIVCEEIERFFNDISGSVFCEESQKAILQLNTSDYLAWRTEKGLDRDD